MRHIRKGSIVSSFFRFALVVLVFLYQQPSISAEASDLRVLTTPHGKDRADGDDLLVVYKDGAALAFRDKNSSNLFCKPKVWVLDSTTYLLRTESCGSSLQTALLIIDASEGKHEIELVDGILSTVSQQFDADYDSRTGNVTLKSVSQYGPSYIPDGFLLSASPSGFAFLSIQNKVVAPKENASISQLVARDVARYAHRTGALRERKCSVFRRDTLRLATSEGVNLCEHYGEIQRYVEYLQGQPSERLRFFDAVTVTANPNGR